MSNEAKLNGIGDVAAGNQNAQSEQRHREAAQ
jgi:hypothetical protein